MQKIKYGITPRRRSANGSVVTGWQQNAVVDGLAENVTLHRVAVDATLSVGLTD
jgi:hypothetical protein